MDKLKIEHTIRIKGLGRTILAVSALQMVFAVGARLVNKDLIEALDKFGKKVEDRTIITDFKITSKDDSGTEA